MRLRRFLISEPMAARTVANNAQKCHIGTGADVLAWGCVRQSSAFYSFLWAEGQTSRGSVGGIGRGWCNGSTGSFGVPSRGSKPRPRAMWKAVN